MEEKGIDLSPLRPKMLSSEMLDQADAVISMGCSAGELCTVPTVDNEPSNLEAVARLDESREILLLHANTIFESKRTGIPKGSVQGDMYDLAEVAREVLESIGRFDKSVKIDFKETGAVIDAVIDLLGEYNFTDSRLWFKGRLDVLGEAGFRRLRRAFPSAVLQCPVDFLAPVIQVVPDKADELLDLLAGWGVDRVSVKWETANMGPILDHLDERKIDVNIYMVPDLESFLKAVLMEPKSITSDFNFPAWHYYGRGSGENGLYYDYLIRASNKAAVGAGSESAWSHSRSLGGHSVCRPAVHVSFSTCEADSVGSACLSDAGSPPTTHRILPGHCHEECYAGATKSA